MIIYPKPYAGCQIPMNEIISSVKQLFNIDIFATEGGLKCLKSDVSNDLIAYLKDNKIQIGRAHV